MDEKIKILLFGVLVEKVEKNELFFSIEKDTDTFMSNLKTRYPVLNELKFSLAINKKIISENTVLNSHDEIALLPPFSGG